MPGCEASHSQTEPRRFQWPKKPSFQINAVFLEYCIAKRNGNNKNSTLNYFVLKEKQKPLEHYSNPTAFSHPHGKQSQSIIPSCFFSNFTAEIKDTGSFILALQRCQRVSNKILLGGAILVHVLAVRHKKRKSTTAESFHSQWGESKHLQPGPTKPQRHSLPCVTSEKLIWGSKSMRQGRYCHDCITEQLRWAYECFRSKAGTAVNSKRNHKNNPHEINTCILCCSSPD